MQPNFDISHHEENSWTIVEIYGEADVYTAGRIRAHLVDRIREGHLRIIIDLLGVRFMDSAGLGALVAIHRRLHALGGEVRLVLTNGHLRRLFHPRRPAQRLPDLRIGRRGEGRTVKRWSPGRHRGGKHRAGTARP